MPYLLKLSERRKGGRLNYGWIKYVILLAWYVAHSCEIKQSKNVRFYLVTKKKPSSIRVDRSSRNSNMSLYIPNNTTTPSASIAESSNPKNSFFITKSSSDIESHIYRYEYISEEEIQSCQLKKLGPAVNDELLSQLQHFKDDNGILYHIISNLPKTNPIYKILFTDNFAARKNARFENIDDLYIHITCEGYDNSIKKSGLLGETYLSKNPHYRTINNELDEYKVNNELDEYKDTTGGKIKNKTRRSFKKQHNKSIQRK